MKIALSISPNGFNERWVEYCKKNYIDYKLVDPCSTSIISDLKDCDAFLWHWHHADYRHQRFARQLIASLSHTKIKVFPNIDTCWHFDDKIGQKYLLEALGIDLVPTYVFYEEKTAADWAKKTSYPKVFKLSGGAGSANVKLVRNKKQCLHLIHKMFHVGFPAYSRWNSFLERTRKLREHLISPWTFCKYMKPVILGTQYGKMTGRIRGYAYFQDFVPDNTHDIRIVVIGKKAFAIRRNCRKNDFRASGSGEIIYQIDAESVTCAKKAFEIASILKMQSCAMDFVFGENKPLLVEISYGFAVHGYDRCSGYWDDDMTWHEGCFNPQEWMIEDLISTLHK